MKIKNILIYILFQTYCVLLRETARGTVEGELSGGEAAKRKRSGKPPYSPKKSSEQIMGCKKLAFFTAPQSKKEYENENNCAVCVTQPKDKHKM